MLILRPLPGGGAQVVPTTFRTVDVRRRAQALGLTGVGVMGRTAESLPGRGLSFGGILRGVARGAVGFLTGGIPGAITGVIARPGGGGGTGGESFAPGCPTGFRKDAQGRCVKEGIVGGIQRFLPGGQTGVLPQTGTQTGQAMEAVVGAFGIPALLPMQAGVIARNDGTQAPILRCVAGFVLGRDDLCYPRAVLGARGKFRKHPAARKPPVTVADAQAIRRATAARGRVKRLAGDVGFTCAVRGSGRRRK